jgi:hypothetical protein
MHIEFLIEDSSGKAMLNLLVPKLIGAEHTWRIHSYRGIGRIPSDLKGKPEPAKRILLANLPRLLSGFGRTFQDYPRECATAVVVICDLDQKCLKRFRSELYGVLQKCTIAPKTAFCIAVEEGEAWLLGDLKAIKRAFPKAKEAPLRGYSNDDICGTWEVLADALYSGGAHALLQQGWYAVGQEKSKWARAITPHLDVEGNQSPSFQYFRKKLRSLPKEDECP